MGEAAGKLPVKSSQSLPGGRPFYQAFVTGPSGERTGRLQNRTSGLYSSLDCSISSRYMRGGIESRRVVPSGFAKYYILSNEVAARSRRHAYCMGEQYVAPNRIDMRQ